MKTKLYVAGIGGCLLLTMAYLKPFELFSSDSSRQSRQELSGTTGLLNYEKSNIPGLEIKTPAKIAIVNKVSAVKLKKEAEKKKTQSKERKSEDENLLSKTASSMMHAVQDLVMDESQPPANSSEDMAAIEASPDIHPYVATSRAAARKIPVKPAASLPKPSVSAPEPQLVSVPEPRKKGRTVVNYSSGEYVINTSNTSYQPNTDNVVRENNKFPHENNEELVAPESAEIISKTESSAKIGKVEKTYSFRGKTEVKSDLYKYIPPFWDGFSAEIGSNAADYLDIMKKARKLAEMAKKGGYNTEYAFLADMSVKSNKNRFFIVNLKTMKVEKSALVAQGRGSERLNLDKEYSNVPGSNCSSLGIYKIGKSYNGSFGLS